MSVYRRPSSNPFRDYEPRYGAQSERAFREFAARKENEHAQAQRDYSAFMSSHVAAPIDLVCINGVWQLPSP